VGPEVAAEKALLAPIGPGPFCPNMYVRNDSRAVCDDPCAVCCCDTLVCACELRCEGTRESLAFEDRGDAFAPAPRVRSRSCCNVAETDLVVVLVTAVDATAPGGNSSAESVAASSSFAPIIEEPFVIVADPPVGSVDLGWVAQIINEGKWSEHS
jgi:hypothetical protein